MIEDIIQSFFNWYSEMVYDIIGSYWILLLFISSILILLLYILKKYHIKNLKILFLEFIFILLFILIGIFPFNRGNKINSLKNLGFKVVESIQKLKQEGQNIPQELKDLNPMYLNENELKIISENFRYKVFVNSDSTNYFELHITPDFMKPEYFFYDMNERTI